MNKLKLSALISLSTFLCLSIYTNADARTYSYGMLCKNKNIPKTYIVSSPKLSEFCKYRNYRRASYKTEPHRKRGWYCVEGQRSTDYDIMINTVDACRYQYRKALGVEVLETCYKLMRGIDLGHPNDHKNPQCVSRFKD